MSFGAADAQRAHRLSSFFRSRDVRRPSARKRLLLNAGNPGADAHLRFSRPFYRVEETTGAGRRIAYYVFDIKYGAGRKITSYHETSARKRLEYEFHRSHITYDSLGQVGSYHEKGTDTGRVRYQFDRTQMTYQRGRLTSFSEGGRRNGARYSLRRTGIVYDKDGHMTSYRESGEITRPGGVRSMYSLTRSNMEYDAGELTGFRERGSKDGESYTRDRRKIKYLGDRPTSFSETGERGGKHYKVSRSRITYKGDEVVSYDEGGSDRVQKRPKATGARPRKKPEGR